MTIWLCKQDYLINIDYLSLANSEFDKILVDLPVNRSILALKVKAGLDEVRCEI